MDGNHWRSDQPVLHVEAVALALELRKPSAAAQHVSHIPSLALFPGAASDLRDDPFGGFVTLGSE
jgi:hypothetical protein